MRIGRGDAEAKELSCQEWISFGNPHAVYGRRDATPSSRSVHESGKEIRPVYMHSELDQNQLCLTDHST